MSTITNMEYKSNERASNWNGTVRQRTNGLWEARLAIDGIRKSFYGKTESEALKKMRLYRKDPIVGKGNSKSVILNDYIEHYLHVYKFGVIKDSTYDRYESIYLHHIHDTIGKRQIVNIHSDEVQMMVNKKVNPAKLGDKPLSRSSLKKIVELLNMVFRHAVNQRLIQENPMTCVVLPNSCKFKIPVKETFSLEEDELQRIKLVADSTTQDGKPKYRYAYLFMLLLNTGLRCGELLALTWDDVDFVNKTIVVNKSVMVNVKQRDAQGNVISRSNVLSSTKTESGERTIPLSSQALYYLKLNHQYNMEQNINSPYVAYSEAGTRATARNLQRTLDAVLEKANVRHCGLHILRHTFGSVLLAKGVEISVVSELMGHSSTKITYDKYIHVFKEQKVNAIELLNVI